MNMIPIISAGRKAYLFKERSEDHNTKDNWQVIYSI